MRCARRGLQALQAGKGYAGVTIVAVRLATKGAFPHDFRGVRSATLIYFGLAEVVMLLCFLQLALLPVVLGCGAPIRRGSTLNPHKPAGQQRQDARAAHSLADRRHSTSFDFR